MSGLRSPCGDEGDVPQGVEGGVAVVSRILASEGNGVNKKPRGILSVLERTRSELEGGGVSADWFARGVHDSWRIGKHGCDNGFLLVASQADRTFAISVVSCAVKQARPRPLNGLLSPVSRKRGELVRFSRTAVEMGNVAAEWDWSRDTFIGLIGSKTFSKYIYNMLPFRGHAALVTCCSPLSTCGEFLAVTRSFLNQSPKARATCVFGGDPDPESDRT